MKKYLVQKTLSAEPMLQCEAEKLLGRKINNSTPKDNGYYVYDPDSKEYGWIPSSKFDGHPNETVNDKLNNFRRSIDDWQKFFRRYSKHKNGQVSQNERLQIYQLNKFLNGIKTTALRIISINMIQK